MGHRQAVGLGVAGLGGVGHTRPAGVGQTQGAGHQMCIRDRACIPVSALTGMGLNDLLERIALEAEVMERKANPNRRAKGAVGEARLDVYKRQGKTTARTGC